MDEAEESSSASYSNDGSMSGDEDWEGVSVTDPVVDDNEENVSLVVRLESSSLCSKEYVLSLE